MAYDSTAIRLIALLILYFCGHAVMRFLLGAPLTSSEALMLEEAAQLGSIGTPVLSALIICLSNLLGSDLMALAGAKNLLLLVLHLSVYATVRMVAPAAAAILALCSLAFLPALIWNAHHVHTGTLLAATLFALLVMTTTTLAHRPRWITYVAFGAHLGLGLLSHPSFGLAALALLVAISLSRSHRHILKPAPFAVSLAVAISMLLAAKGPSGLLSLPGASLTGLEPVLNLSSVAYAFDTLQAFILFLAILMFGALGAIYRGLGPHNALMPEAVGLRQLLTHTVAIWTVLILGQAFLFQTPITASENLLAGLFLAGPATALYLYPLLALHAQRQVTSVATGLALLILITLPAYTSLGPQAEMQAELQRMSAEEERLALR